MIIIASVVLHELEDAPFFDSILHLIASNVIKVKSIDVRASEDLGAGEMESIALAAQTRDILLMSDRSALRYAEQRSIVVFDIPTFLFYCKKKKILLKKDIQEIMRELIQKDYYEFSDDVTKALLE